MASKYSNSQNEEMPEWIPRATFTVIGSVLVVAAGFWIIRALSTLIAWIVISLFLSFALEPLTNKLQRRGWKRGTATGIILLTVFLIIAVFLGSMVPLVIDQSRELIKEGPRFASQITNFTQARLGITILNEDILTSITKFASSFGVGGDDVASSVIGVGGKVAGGVFQVFTILIFTYYLVVDGPAVRRKSMALMPAKQQKMFLETWEIAIEKMGGYLYARLILAGLSAFASFIVLSVLQVPYALPLALWLGLFSQFIPVIGTYIAAALPLFVAVLERPWSAFVLLVFVILYQQFENYWISPKLTARTMQLHPALAIGAALAGGFLYGAIGAFLALPAAAILQVIIGTYITRHEVISDDGDLLGVQKSSKVLK